MKILPLTALAWLIAVIPAVATPPDTIWKLVPIQTSEGTWKQAIQVETVPGVRYYLQRSPDLSEGSWSNLSTIYGMGGPWICPVLPGHPPASGVIIPEIQIIPVAPSQPIRQANLVLGRNAAGEMVVSWASLDDGSPKRKVLSDLEMDPIWEEHDGFYLNHHGSYFLGLSPQFSTASSITTSSDSFGPLDLDLLDVFEADFDQISDRIANNVPEAASYSPVVENTGGREFFRILADWGVDSNGGGRYDWQQLMLDETDPFSPGSGPGGSDLTSNAGGSGGYPAAGAVAPLQPLAHIEQQTFDFTGFKPSLGRVEIDYRVTASESEFHDLENAARHSYAAFRGAVDQLELPDDFWFEAPLQNFSDTWLKQVAPGQNGQPGATTHVFIYSRTRFRLRLDGAAPPGGYSIPVRVGIVRQVMNPNPMTASIAPRRSGETLYIDLMLTCPEGESEGPAVDFSPLSDIDENQRFTYVPATVSTREPDIIIGGDVEGAIPGPVPDNGLCVVENSIFNANFGNQLAPYLAHYDGELPKVYWKKSQLNGNGTLGGWNYLTTVGYAPVPYEGTHVHMNAKNRGIYQLQAVLTLPNGAEIEYPFVRMRSAKAGANYRGIANPLLKAGEADYYGVAPNQISKNLRDAAVSWLGSKAYSFDSRVTVESGQIYNPDTYKRSKCNFLVTHLANSVGAVTPYYYRRGFVPTAPIARDDWFGEPELNIDLDRPGWKFEGISGNPSPGYSVASPGAGGDAASSGHVGILDYDGSWINAGRENINKSLHLMDESENYKPNHFRAR